MTGLIVLGSLASVAMIVIYTVKHLQDEQEDKAVKDDAVNRHQLTLTHEQAGQLSSELCAVRGEGGVVNFFVDKDNVFQITVGKKKK